MNIGEKIRQRREVISLSQVRLSETVGVDSNTISRWERNLYKVAADYLPKLAIALETSTAYLMGETDDPRPQNANLLGHHVTATSGDQSTTIGFIDASAGGLRDSPVSISGQSIIFERSEGPAKIRLILPPTPETYEFLREQLPSVNETDKELQK
jgi:transcriptional regulator with XRE-family HTH domain